MASVKYHVRLTDEIDRELTEAAPYFGGKSEAMRSLLEQSFKARRHPGIYFCTTGSGLVTAFIAGVEIWVVVETVLANRKGGMTAEAAVASAAEVHGTSEATVRTALAYYADYSDEIDEAIADNQRVVTELTERSQRIEELLA